MRSAITTYANWFYYLTTVLCVLAPPKGRSVIHSFVNASDPTGGPAQDPLLGGHAS